ALEIANNTEFGLTGSVFTKNPEKIRKAEEMFHVGNLYLNRKCTGAMVGAHPFGGFNMSGTDSKTGGKDYLLLFLQAKSIAEKVRNRRAQLRWSTDSPTRGKADSSAVRSYAERKGKCR